MSATPSTTIISSLKSVTAPTANSFKAANAGGIDINGMMALAQSKTFELKACLTLLARSTDSADPNLATINNILASLV